MDLVSRDASGQETERAKIYAQDGMLHMDQGPDAEAAMIFLGDSFLYVNHRDKSYIVMDEAMLEEVSAQISDAMKEVEAQLANMPPEQRAMVEQMMQGEMKGMMGKQGSAAPKPRVERLGTSKWQSYACRQYAVYEGQDKTQQVCASKLDDVPGADEAIEAFIGMAAYMRKMAESMPMFKDEGLNPGDLMDQIDGFPVHTIDYRNGKVLQETSLDSVSEQDLDEKLFEAPAGYRRENPLGRR
jgi:hypothetical protein